ncbi:AlpA family transcriptional regulator [Massilia luteola]|uniref:helix-turn-helix transcriptional regulator n=1 Tax=Massilia luteola TaxID=3081751 RepID=UPI002ACC1BB2|nr:AlpA family transcriptional regulator [Massilia sp. Gc5]
MTSDMYLRIKQVTALTGLSRATIYNMMAAGSFPMKTALGVRAVGWLSSEIQVWMAERKLVEKQGREATPAKRRAATPRRLPEVSPVRSTPPSKAENVGSKILHGWEDSDDTVPTPAEKEAIRNRLRLLNAKKKSAG